MHELFAINILTKHNCTQCVTALTGCAVLYCEYNYTSEQWKHYLK